MKSYSDQTEYHGLDLIRHEKQKLMKRGGVLFLTLLVFCFAFVFFFFRQMASTFEGADDNVVFLLKAMLIGIGGAVFIGLIVLGFIFAQKIHRLSLLESVRPVYGRIEDVLVERIVTVNDNRVSQESYHPYVVIRDVATEKLYFRLRAFDQ